MMTRHAYLRLLKLLPRLDAKREKALLKTLTEIRGLFNAEDLDWTDVAHAMVEPRDSYPPDGLLKMVGHIEARPEILSERAHYFLRQVRMWAAIGEPVQLSPKQAEWLEGLYEQADKPDVFETPEARWARNAFLGADDTGTRH
jgi:hypothetical protein